LSYRAAEEVVEVVRILHARRDAGDLLGEWLD
jgi:plasmid stabilization system protein ParE